MTRHIIVGAGPTGSRTAELLAEGGDEVRLVARTPRPVSHPRIEPLALDASNADALTAASEGARTIFMCAMPRYDRWPELFPPIMDSVVIAAERVGARIVSVGNIYPYGALAPSRLTESLSLRPTTVKGRVRAEMWERARASKAPATEVRGSDYLGDGALSLFTLMALAAITSGKPAAVPGDLDAVRPWTFVGDVARTLVAASRHSESWGRAFHVPSLHVSTRELAARFAEAAGAPAPALTRLSVAELAAAGETDSLAREVVEMAYLFERPLELDASDAERLLGIHATPLAEVVRDGLRSHPTATSTSSAARGS